MQLFYATGITGQFVTLGKTESNHCINVLRHGTGDIIRIIDGSGGIYAARIIEADPRACKVEITDYFPGDNSRPKLHLAIAPPKHSDRFEWFIEKAVELGVGQITPIRCQRSERKEIKAERLEKIIIASMKQAMVAKQPVLHDMISCSQFIRSDDPLHSDKFIATCSESMNKPLHESLVKGNPVILLIGPEGDFTPEEIKLAKASDYKPVSMGAQRLRTETAALAGCITFNLFNP
ncbi:MAG: methyltransferase, RsmE family [Bacteroidetes bacterium]|jgi:16S rRNA (uracil1498-N3)-methyltransferase|nr:methyltransferase, RsmE family [Bacteroidota bacterium]